MTSGLEWLTIILYNLVAVTDVVKLRLQGKTPIPVRGVLFGAKLLTIAKK